MLILVRNFFLTFLITATLCFPIFATSSLVGTGAMEFVNLISTSKSDSLGGAVSAIQSFDGAYVNPASVSHISSTHIYSQYLDYFDDIEFKNISLIQSFSFATVGIGYSSFDLGSHSRTTLSDKSGAGTNLVTNESSLIQLFYSIKLNSLLIGSSFKHAVEILDQIESSQQSIDTGIQYLFNHNFSLGAAINNISLRKVKFIQDEARLLTDFRLGLMYKPHFFDYNLMLATDFIYSDLKEWCYSFGFDLKLHEYLQLRFGYQNVTDLMGVSFGVGLNLDPLIIDFSYRIEDNFSDVYRIGVGLKL
tara:strand:- start:230 stop:1144 length:915 start_codon:yes stop_codon:yes gene_type:complete